MERYYQIARCYRDEDFRADRQPEFTQLDIEMSFVTQDDVIELAEEIVAALWSELAGVRDLAPIPRLTWHDAMARYGSDKPDLRYGLELIDLTDYLHRHRVPGVRRRHRGRRLRRRGRHARRRRADPQGARRLAGLGQGARRARAWPTWCSTPRPARPAARWPRTSPPSTWPAWPTRSAPSRATPSSSPPPSNRREAQELLGAARIEIARRAGLVDPDAWAFCWVVDAPMFEPPRRDRQPAGWTAVHHPFTSPNDEWIDSFESAPGEALAYAYDIVCNGNEIGGGSIRIHRADVQRRVFDLLGITPGGGAGQVRLPARGVQVRPAAARRDRARLGPHLHAAGRGGLDPRGDRVPEDPRRLRPADRCARRRSPPSSAWRPASTPSPRPPPPRRVPVATDFAGRCWLSVGGWT